MLDDEGTKRKSNTKVADSEEAKQKARAEMRAKLALPDSVKQKLGAP